MTSKLILASTSPYRRLLLERLGIAFDCIAPGVDETRLPGESGKELARRLARAKAESVMAGNKDAVVIGSDQVAVLGDDILGKPGDFETAKRQLAAASGKSVRFYTALCVIKAASDGDHVHVDETVVRFRDITEEEIIRYLEKEHALDCAGSFKSEGLGICLFDAIETDDPTALMGMPLIALCRFLQLEGISLP